LSPLYRTSLPIPETIRSALALKLAVLISS
jgi:hypothetical protein